MQVLCKEQKLPNNNLDQQNLYKMKKLSQISLIAVLLLSLNSCYINRHTVGDGPQGKAKKSQTKTFARKKQVYLFWGSIAAGTAQPRIPTDQGYQIKSSYNVGDMFINALTGGIVGTRTVKIIVYKDKK
jgi:hypothetical protein